MSLRAGIFVDNIPKPYPKWFKEKYKDSIIFPEDTGCICSLTSFSRLSYQLEEDIQLVLIEQEAPYSLECLYLHESGGITKIIITTKDIKYYEAPADSYREVPEIFAGYGG